MNSLFSGEAIAERLFLFIPVIMSLSVHEWAHARAAFALGDETAYRLGRLTLNPLSHIDPIGTFLLPLLGIPFGWARPVPFEPTKFHKNVPMARGAMMVALAGPVSNLAIALIAIIILSILHPQLQATDLPMTLPPEIEFLRMMFVINVMLAAFNLLPVFPLDGSHILKGLLPYKVASLLGNNSTLSFLILICGITFLGPFVHHWADGVLATATQ